VGGEFGTVVAADELGASASGAEDLVQAGDGGIGVDAVVDEIGEGLAGVLVDDVQNLDCAPSAGDVDLVVERTPVVRSLGPQPCARGGESPSRRRLRRLGGTRRPSSRHSRWIFLRFTPQPSRRSTARARR
jgi:hypothetical protein